MKDTTEDFFTTESTEITEALARKKENPSSPSRRASVLGDLGGKKSSVLFFTDRQRK